MSEVVVGALCFRFPDGWSVGQYDAWAFYTRRWIKVRDGVKAVDLLACSPAGHAWLIEVKDYRQHRRTKPISLPDEIVAKVFDTLAAMVPARVNGDVDEEVDLASKVGRAVKLRVVVHLEQPRQHSKLFPRAFDPANVQQALRQRLKPVDAHPLVCESSRMGGVPWTVTAAPPGPGT